MIFSFVEFRGVSWSFVGACFRALISSDPSHTSCVFHFHEKKKMKKEVFGDASRRPPPTWRRARREHYSAHTPWVRKFCEVRGVSLGDLGAPYRSCEKVKRSERSRARLKPGRGRGGVIEGARGSISVFELNGQKKNHYYTCQQFYHLHIATHRHHNNQTCTLLQLTQPFQQYQNENVRFHSNAI